MFLGSKGWDQEDEGTVKELRKIKPLSYTNKRMTVIISPTQP